MTRTDLEQEMPLLLLGIRDVHSIARSDLEGLQPSHRDAGLHVVVEFYKRDAWPCIHHTHFLEAWELLEQHAEHLAVGCSRQVLHKQYLVWRLDSSCHLHSTLVL